MGKLVIPIGPSGSGKSTLLRKTYNKEDDIIISSDGIRGELTGNEADQSKNAEVFEEFYKRIDEGLKAGKRVVADATNLDKRARSKLYQLGRDNNSLIDIVLLSVSLEVCLRGNNSRERKFPEDIVKKQYGYYLNARNDVENEIKELREKGIEYDICEVIYPNRENKERTPKSDGIGDR